MRAGKAFLHTCGVHRAFLQTFRVHIVEIKDNVDAKEAWALGVGLRFTEYDFSTCGFGTHLRTSNGVGFRVSQN